MTTIERSGLPGTATDAMAGSAFPLDPRQDQTSRELLVRMLRVMYPHDRLGDAPYQRTADAVFAAAGKTVGQKVAFCAALHDLSGEGFADLSDAAAVEHLTSIEGSAFFELVRSAAVVALYDDEDVWEVLGYEGPSYDKGGYIDRGFNDLDWLPEPRIEEEGAAR
jgi:hypothetical protein